MPATTEAPANAEAVGTPVADAPLKPMSGAELAAAFSKRRASTRVSPAPESPKEDATHPEEPTVPAATVETPETEVPPEQNDESNAASTSGEPAAAEETPETVEEPVADETPDEKPVQKRINELTAKFREEERKRLAAEDRLRELESKPDERTPQTVTATGGEFGHDKEVRELTAQLEKVKGALAWLDRNPDGGEVLNGKGDVIATVSPEEAVKWREQYGEQANELRVLRSVRQRELKAQMDATRSQANQLLEQRFGWAKEAGSKQMENLRQIEAVVPEINRLPGWKLLVAHGLEGMEKAMATGQPQKSRPATPPKVAVPTGAGAPKTDPLTKQLREAEAAFEKSHKSEDYQRVLSLRRQAKRQAQ